MSDIGISAPAAPQRIPVLDAATAAARLGRLAASGGRVIVGLAGPPGAGKSTIAAWLAQNAARPVTVVPMDGFHLANAELDRQGTRSRKGSPATFDAAGFASLIARIRADDGDAVYAPDFDRARDEPIAGSIRIGPDDRVVITEGNYLLQPGGAWARVRPLLDEAWWVDCQPVERHGRLVRRHRQFGRTDADARRFVDESDEANAATVEADRARADFAIDQLPHG